MVGSPQIAPNEIDCLEGMIKLQVVTCTMSKHELGDSVVTTIGTPKPQLDWFCVVKNEKFTKVLARHTWGPFIEGRVYG